MQWFDEEVPTKDNLLDHSLLLYYGLLVQRLPSIYVKAFFLTIILFYGSISIIICFNDLGILFSLCLCTEILAISATSDKELNLTKQIELSGLGLKNKGLKKYY